LVKLEENENQTTYILSLVNLILKAV